MPKPSTFEEKSVWNPTRPIKEDQLLGFPEALEMSSADEADLAKQLQAQREEDMLLGLKNASGAVFLSLRGRAYFEARARGDVQDAGRRSEWTGLANSPGSGADNKSRVTETRKLFSGELGGVHAGAKLPPFGHEALERCKGTPDPRAFFFCICKHVKAQASRKP